MFCFLGWLGFGKRLLEVSLQGLVVDMEDMVGATGATILVGVMVVVAAGALAMVGGVVRHGPQQLSVELLQTLFCLFASSLQM
jgi:hypothetical protein